MSEREKVVVKGRDEWKPRDTNFDIWEASVLVDSFTDAVLARRVANDEFRLSICRDGAGELTFKTEPIERWRRIDLRVDGHDIISDCAVSEHEDAGAHGGTDAGVDRVVRVQREPMSRVVNEMVKGHEARFRVHPSMWVIIVPLKGFNELVRDWLLGVVETTIDEAP